MGVFYSSRNNDTSYLSKVEQAYQEFEKYLDSDREVLPAISVDGVRLYDVRQDGREGWDETHRGISQEEARAVYDDILVDLDIDLSTDTDLPPANKHFHIMADNVFADRIYVPPQYLHLAVDDLQLTGTDFTTAVDQLLTLAESEKMEIYLDNQQLPIAVDEAMLAEPVESPENELYAELTRRLDGNRPLGEHVVQKLRFEYPVLDNSVTMADQFFLLLMASDSRQGYYPLFTLPSGRYDEKKEATLAVVDLLEK